MYRLAPATECNDPSYSDGGVAYGDRVMLSVAVHFLIRILALVFEVATINFAPQWQANPLWARLSCRES